MTKQQLLELVQGLPDDGRPFAVAIWSRNDVIHRAKRIRLKISRADADAIIETMDRQYGAGIGLNRGVVDGHLNLVALERIRLSNS